jgi:hypothetical protein
MSAPTFIYPPPTTGGTPVGGSGTPDTIPRWATTTTLTNSGLLDNGTSIYTTARRFGVGVIPDVAYSSQVASGHAVWDGNAANGRVVTWASGSAATGYIEWRIGGGARLGYIGASSTDMLLQLENSADFAVMGGNVGVNTTVPVNVGGYTSVTVNNASSGGVFAVQSAGVTRGQFFTNNTSTFLEAIGVPLVFNVGSAERARLDSSGQLFRWNTFTDSSNYKGTRLSSATYSGAEYSTLTVVGIGTFASSNIGLVLQPLGTGAITAQMPDGTATGGNARGANAVDLQMGRASAGQVASQLYATIPGGFGNTASAQSTFAAGQSCNASAQYAIAMGNNSAASGANSVAIGQSNTASGANSVAIGQGCTASNTVAVAMGSGNTSAGYGSTSFGEGNAANASYTVATGNRAVCALLGQIAHANGRFAASGDAQMSRLIARNSTTDATKTTLFLDGASVRLVLPASTTWAATIYVNGRSTGGTDNAFYIRQCLIKRDGANNTALVGTVQTVGTDIESNAAWDVEVTADDTNEALQIAVTGAAATTIRWVARVELVEVGLA